MFPYQDDPAQCEKSVFEDSLPLSTHLKVFYTLDVAYEEIQAVVKQQIFPSLGKGGHLKCAFYNIGTRVFFLMII